MSKSKAIKGTEKIENTLVKNSNLHKSAKSVNPAELPKCANLFHKTTKSTKSISIKYPALTALETGDCETKDGRQKTGDRRRKSGSRRQ